MEMVGCSSVRVLVGRGVTCQNNLVHLGWIGVSKDAAAYSSTTSIKIQGEIIFPRLDSLTAAFALQLRIRVATSSLANKSCYHIDPLCIASISASCRHCPQKWYRP